MMTFLSGLWPKILVVLAIVGAALGAIALLRKGGADAEKVKELARIAKSRSEADAIRARVDSASPADLDKLRSKWTAG